MPRLSHYFQAGKDEEKSKSRQPFTGEDARSAMREIGPSAVKGKAKTMDHMNHAEMAFWVSATGMGLWTGCFW